MKAQEPYHFPCCFQLRIYNKFAKHPTFTLSRPLADDSYHNASIKSVNVGNMLEINRAKWYDFCSTIRLKPRGGVVPEGFL